MYSKEIVTREIDDLIAEMCEPSSNKRRNNMIPKIVHYAWYGQPMPKNISLRIKEWKKILPDWEFQCWNESNYNFKQFKFTKIKLSKGEYGYASDELRYDVLNKFGGFYLDTDMIIKKDLSPMLDKKLVMGFMYDNSVLTSFIGSEPHNPILELFLDYYADPKYESQLFSMTSNPFVTNILGNTFPNIHLDGKTQEFSPKGVIYSRDYFCYPSRDKNANYAEHLFDNAWDHGRAYGGVKGKIKSALHAVAPITYGKIANYRGVKYSRQFIHHLDQ